MQSNILNILFGTGVGSSFRSFRGYEMTTFELSYVDYFRQVGVVGMLLFLNFIIKPVRDLFKHDRWLLIGYLGYLAVAFTNPLLVTSTSFMMYLIIYSEFLKYHRTA